ncbi:SET domain-containing protein [Nonomuraea sp. SBT364]|uniref:SET domain-containing protein n=1 Tax=Nonomuraea sp. SBT364 TaxID=1580530 RepID=UPI00066AADFA|nr:SET domain-containing protein-lysine N-methyltransferase [Nonomuraea sp. SBT364]
MTPPAYEADCWLTPSAQPRLSPIDGIGLFAIERIRRDEVVMRLGGRVIDDEGLARLTPPYSSLTVAEGTHLLLDPAHPVRYGNHSCDPTLWHRDATTVIARRDLDQGEELTLDYATHTGVASWSMTCRCATSLCRRVVTGDDWRLARLQATYGTHWSPPLLGRIRALQGR